MMAAAIVLMACQGTQSTDGSATDSTIVEAELTQEEAMTAFAEELYDDILPMYNDGSICELSTGEEDGEQAASETSLIGRYGSQSLQQFLREADEWRRETQADILGWDCDPWIMAQDWNQLEAEVLGAETVNDSTGRVDVLLRDGESERHLTLILAKENGAWKVDDFASTGADKNTPTYRESLIAEYENR